MHFLSKVILVAGLTAVTEACMDPCDFELSSVNYYKVLENVKMAYDFVHSAIRTKVCNVAARARYDEAINDLQTAKSHLKTIADRDFSEFTQTATMQTLNSNCTEEECKPLALNKATRMAYYSAITLNSMWKKAKNGLKGEQCAQLKVDIYDVLLKLDIDIDKVVALIECCKDRYYPIEEGRARQKSSKTVSFW